MRYLVLAIKLFLVPAGLVYFAAALLDDPRFGKLVIGPLPILAALTLCVAIRFLPSVMICWCHTIGLCWSW